MYGNSTIPYSIAMTPLDSNSGGNNGNGMWGDGGLWIIILVILLFGAWGGNGWGNNGGGGYSSVKDQYVLSSDFATIQRQLGDGFNSVNTALDAQNTGICNLGYTTLELNNATNTALMQGFNTLQSQLAACCCDTNAGIERINANNAANTASIQYAINDCCCNVDKQFMQTRYDMATNNCATLQAIDAVGDRVIDYLANQETARLRDENQSLKLAASQQAQNNYIIESLRPAPIPAFAVPAPYQFGFNGCGFGAFNGTTIV